MSICHKLADGWIEGTSGSASPAPNWAWSATGPAFDDSLGVLSWFSEAPADAREAIGECPGHDWVSAVAGGFFVAAIWGIHREDAHDLADDLVRPDRMRFA